jgi:hypothetical protein
MIDLIYGATQILRITPALKEANDIKRVSQYGFDHFGPSSKLDIGRCLRIVARVPVACAGRTRKSGVVANRSNATPVKCPSAPACAEPRECRQMDLPA